MIHIELKVPAVTLKLDKIEITNFLKMVLHQYTESKPNTIYELGAIWLFNKLRTKTTQTKSTIKIPLEYAMLLRTYCNKYAQPTHPLHQVTLYTILEQLDKQLK